MKNQLTFKVQLNWQLISISVNQIYINLTVENMQNYFYTWRDNLTLFNMISNTSALTAFPTHLPAYINPPRLLPKWSLPLLSQLIQKDMQFMTILEEKTKKKTLKIFILYYLFFMFSRSWLLFMVLGEKWWLRWKLR